MSNVIAGRFGRDRSEPLPAEALRDALDADNWDEVPSIIESYWGLLIMCHLPLLREAFATTPAATFDHHPVARAVQEIARRALPRNPGPPLTGDLPADDDDLLALAESDGAAPAVVAAVAGMISTRLRTEWDHARVLADRLVLFLDQVAHSHFDAVSRWLPGIDLEVGITYLMAGDLVSALRHLHRAWIESDLDNIGHVASGAASRLALVHSLRGDAKAADHWIRISRETPIPPAVAEVSRARQTEAVARALVAVARLDDDAIREAEQAMVHDPGNFEQWSMWLHAQARLGLVSGDLVGTRRLLAESEDSQPYLRLPPPHMQVRLLGDRVDVLVASGDGTQARRLLLDSDLRGSRLDVARGRLRLLCGDSAGAISAAKAVLGAVGAGSDDESAALVVSAVAHHRLGRTAEAAAALAAAVALADASGCRWGFGAVPRGELEELSVDVDIPIPGDVRSLSPDGLEVIELSAREHTVLQHLAAGRSAAQIASADFVSINTVKTQIASIYRKLGTSSRDDALQRALDAGILRPDGAPST